MQCVLVPIADRHISYANEVAGRLQTAGFRVEVDGRNEKMGKRIREAEVQKTPVMLVMGDKDIEGGTVSVRKRGEGDLGAKSVDEVIALFREMRDA